MTKKADLVH